MNFGEALELPKEGAKIRRKGWNGKGMYIYLEDWYRILGVAFKPCIIMFTVDGSLQPGWLASQADMLAEDWELAL